MLFSVTTMLDLFWVLSVIVPLTSKMLGLLKMDPSLSPAFISGLFELDWAARWPDHPKYCHGRRIIAVGIIA